MKTVTKLLPGCALALVIAAIAKLLESLEASAGLHLIGASVIALFIGMLVNHFYRPNDATKPGIRFTSKKILKFAIILLGASLNITTVLTVGKFSLTVMLFTLATCFGLGYFIGKALGLNWKTSSLINAGNLDGAKTILDSIQTRNAEWYYLYGIIYLRQGWYDKAREFLGRAYRTEPGNAEYAQAYNTLRYTGNPYSRPRQSTSYGNCSACDICSGLMCADCCCECMGGDLIRCC